MRYFLAMLVCISAVSVPAQAVEVPTISGPLTLADAVQTALKYSPTAKAAGSQADAAQARAGMARAMTNPQIAVSGFAGRSSMGDIITSPPSVMPSSVFSVPDRTAATGQAVLMFPLFTGGRLSGAIGSAEALSAAASSDMASARQNVVLQTRAAYHKALLANATVTVYEDLVKEQQERVRISESAFSEGKIAKYDFLRNQAGLADAQQQLVNAQRDAQIAMVDLRAAMGVSQSSDIKPADELAFVPVKETLEACTARAIQNRPELGAARARVKSAGGNVDTAKSAYLPQIYGTAMGGISASADDSTSGLTVGVSVGIPLLDGGQRGQAVKEAQAMLETMKQDEKQALLDIEQDVHTVWADIQAAEKSVELSEAAVAQAQEDYRVIRLRYEAGKAINVEVLDALASLVRAQNNRLMALYEHSVARDRLARAIGEQPVVTERR